MTEEQKERLFMHHFRFGTGLFLGFLQGVCAGCFFWLWDSAFARGGAALANMLCLAVVFVVLCFCVIGLWWSDIVAIRDEK
jgi:hypothetical protein